MLSRITKKCNQNENFFPLIISIIGPKKVGKTTLNKSIASYFLCEYNEFVYGPLIVVVEKDVSYLFIEASSDILSISNLTKASDIIILVMDGYFGLELEIFEYISLFDTHGVSRVLAALTHIDLFSNWRSLKKSKKRLKTRLKKELTNCTKIFYLTGISIKEMYFPREVCNITRFFSQNFIRNTNLQKSLSYVIITRLDLDFKNEKKKTILIGFQKGKELGKISGCNGYIPGMGKVLLKKLKKYTRQKKKGNKVKMENIKNFYYLEKKSNKFRQKISVSVNIRTFLLNFLILIKINKKINAKFLKKKYLAIVDSDKFKWFTESKNKKIINSIKKQKLPKTKKLNFSNSLSLVFKKNEKESKNKRTFFVEIFLEELFDKFYRYFDPTFPLILCIDLNANFCAHITKALVNRHKWNKKIIRTQDVVFLSMGWKFFEASIVFFEEKSNKKSYLQKCLSYRKSSSVCFVSHPEFSGTGIVAIFNPGNNFCSFHKGTIFNIIFSGKVEEPVTEFKIFKKIKLKGMIFKNFRKTCYVKNMFSTEIEILRFIGSFVHDTSGKKGLIKKPIKHGPPGSFRILSEKNMKKGDNVFLKLLMRVKLNKKTKNSNFFFTPFDFKEMGHLKKK
ncbi:BMS1-like protein (nucleomorph) [Chroomonas mesostigmatica CCMP1168]|uniref:BMS1-like protein n=1 Tax=Chroomonas mesostigmatica CCMP1168 TaxID=1195612 RepID=J7G9S1_9CRYP|nr:BMS1-like protein [Chroomonas mesostigmatica CCMP1168]|mmetsp:Transcript_29552/g.72907  ORF Transcript_29552/g.72907 Transcript_29552/m.72907 type:complete len:620 (-) Transcript_29552:60-1919(-)